MAKTIFVPLTDDLLYEHPERVLGPVIPFSQQARPASTDPGTFGSIISQLNNQTKFEAAGAHTVKVSRNPKKF